MRPELANAMRREVGRDDRSRRAVRNAGRLSAKSQFRGSRTAADSGLVEQYVRKLSQTPDSELHNIVKSLSTGVSSFLNSAEDEARLEAAKRILKERGSRKTSRRRTSRRKISGVTTTSFGGSGYGGMGSLWGSKVLLDGEEIGAYSQYVHFDGDASSYYTPKSYVTGQSGPEMSPEDAVQWIVEQASSGRTASRRTAGNKGRRRSPVARRKFAAADVDDWIDAVRNAIEEWEMHGNYVPGNLTEDDMREYARGAEDYALDGSDDEYMDSERTEAAYEYLGAEGIFDQWQWEGEEMEGMGKDARRALRRRIASEGVCEYCGVNPVDDDEFLQQSKMCIDCGWEYTDEDLMDSDYDAWANKFLGGNQRPPRTARRRTAAMRGSGVDPYDGVDYGKDSLSDFLSDNPDFSGLEVVKEIRSGDELYVEFSNGWGYEGQLIQTPDYDRIDISIFRPDSRGGGSYWDSANDEDDAIELIKKETGVGRTALRRKMAMPLVGEPDFNRMEAGTRAAAYDPNNWTSRKAYDAIIALAKNPPQNPYYVAEATVRTMAENSDGPFGWDSVDREFAFWIMSDASGFPYGEILDAWLESDLGYGEGITARRRTNRNARKEATVNNRRIPTRRPSVAGRTPARRTVARRTVARRTPTGAPVARSGRRPVATRARTAGFARGTVVTLKREAARSRTPLTLRVVATRNGRFVGERLAARRPTGELWEFTSHEVARVVARTPQRRIAPPLARRRRYADQSTSTNFPGMAAPAPSAPAGETPTFDDANLMSPTADADGTEADWMDDPTAPITGAGDVSTTSPTATEYSGTPDELEAPVAGTDADITVDGEVVGLIAEDTGSSTVIPGDATEVTAGRRTEARFFAAQRLAQLRVEAGVMQGDPVVIGHQLVASKMSLNEMQSEIGTLDRVITVRGSVDDDAPRKVAKERKGSLVPRSSGRTVPSMVSAPSAPAVDGDDFALFE